MIISIALWSLQLRCHNHHHQVIKYAMCWLLLVLSNWSTYSTTCCHYLSSYLSSSKLPHHHLHDMAECGLRSGLVIRSPNLQLVMFPAKKDCFKKALLCLQLFGAWQGTYRMSLIGAGAFCGNLLSRGSFVLTKYWTVRWAKHLSCFHSCKIFHKEICFNSWKIINYSSCLRGNTVIHSQFQQSGR